MSTQSLTLVEAINDALHTAMDSGEDVMVYGEDVAEQGGVFRATEGLLDAYGEDRVMDSPLSEIGIVGTAIGLAMQGKRPVVEIQFSGFLPPAFNQLVQMGGRARWRNRGKHGAPLVVRTPYGGGVRALEHHSESLESVYAHIPGIKLVVPATPADAKGMLLSAIDDPDPVIFFEPKRVYRTYREEVPEDGDRIPLGEANVKEPGEDLTIIAWGSMLHYALEAASNLREEGIDAEVLDLRSIFPLDREAITESVKKTGRVVVVHEGPRSGGFAGELVATINEEALMYLEAPVERVTGFDTPMPMLGLEDYYLPNPPRIEEAARTVVEF